MLHLNFLISHFSAQVPFTWSSLLWSFAPPLLVASPGGDIEAGDHHDVGLAAVHSVLQPSRHHLKGLQVLQGVHLERLPQVDCMKIESQVHAVLPFVSEN